MGMMTLFNIFILLVTLIYVKSLCNREGLRNSIKDFYHHTKMAADISTFHKTEYMNQCFDKSGLFSRKSTFRRHYFGEKRCNLSSEKSNHTNNQAICPWYYDITFDKNRLPAVMLDARCRCPRILKMATQLTECKNGGNIAGDVCTCERLKVTFPVLRRWNPSSKWEAVKEDIGVACICKKPIDNNYN